MIQSGGAARSASSTVRSDVATTATSDPCERLAGRGGEQPVAGAAAGLDVPQVGADEPLGVDDRVVDPDVEALADQPLGQLDVRALPQVVGVHLEAEAEHGAPVRHAAGDHPVDDVADDQLVGQRVPASSGTSTSLTRAMCCSARRSLGRQEPP